MAALVRDHWSVEGATAGPFPDGASLRSGHRGWVLVGDDARRLGGAMAWARQQGVEELHVLADDPATAGVLARRASQFAAPPEVWRVEGRTLRPAAAAPPPTFPAPSPSAELFRPLLAAAGLEVVVEQGQLIGELHGLEVARVVSPEGDPAGARLEVGVGRFDREAFALMNADLPDAEALAKAVGIVGGYRRAGAPHHQLNRLVPERWFRAAVVAEPGLVGADHLEPVESAAPRRDLTAPWPASAVGVDGEGRPLVVTCSTGVDLDLVPAAADDRSAHAPGARLVLALPERDRLPVTEALAAALLDPAEIVAVDDRWRPRA